MADCVVAVDKAVGALPGSADRGLHPWEVYLRFHLPRKAAGVIDKAVGQ
jgi:hypothetical protein